MVQTMPNTESTVGIQPGPATRVADAWGHWSLLDIGELPMSEILS